MDVKDLNKTTGGDLVYSGVKGILGAIPFAGATAQEILGLIIKSPLEKRRNEWMEYIGAKLIELEQKKGIDLESLSNNDAFVDIVLQISSSVLKTNIYEKKEGFKNALLNSIEVVDTDKAINETFINVLDSFTYWHLKVLQAINNFAELRKKHFPEGKYSYLDTHYEARGIFQKFYPELMSIDLLSIIWADLSRVNFIEIKFEQQVVLRDVDYHLTGLGQRFYKFISEPG